MTLLELDGVTRRFGSVAAVDEVSLEIREGEFFALLGPSGCGKTTLLRILAGFERPDQGEVRLDGEEITDLPARYRPLNLMFQSYALFPHMSVAANVAYGLEMEGLRRREIRERVAEILETTQLSDFARRRPSQLSGGQRQRVALARALVKRPRVMLLDEPLGALDRKLRQEMQLELKRLQHELGITFLVVTHDQEEALVMADRIALMLDGRIMQLGPPYELYERPESRFVAHFLGNTNFLEGHVAGESLRVPGLGLLKGEMPKPISEGAPAVLAVRPERLLLSAGALRADNAFDAKLLELAYHGQDLMLHLVIEGLDKRLIARATAAAFEALGLEAGKPLRIGFESKHARILRA